MSHIVSHLQPRQRRFVAGASVAIGTLGAIVLVGWIGTSEVMKSVVPGLPSMKPNAALCFLLTSVTLGATCRKTAHPLKWRVAGSAAATIVASLAMATLYEYGANVNLGLDDCLGLTDEPEAARLFPGRMAPATAAHFSVLGLALLCRQSARLRFLSSALSGVSFAASALPIIGFLFGVSSLYSIVPYTSMAIHTAIGLAIASLGVWSSSTRSGFPQQLFETGLSGQIMRSLLPFAIALPLLIGTLVVICRHFTDFDISFGLSAITIGNIVLFSLLSSWSARNIARSAKQCQETERALQESQLRSEVEEEQRHNIARKRLIEQTMLAREDEQRRIARDLHDGLGQLLLSLRFGLSGIERAASLAVAQEKVPQLRSQIVQGQGEIRRIIGDLRPVTLDELGLTPALGRLTAEFSRDHGIGISLDANEVSQHRLSPSLETAIFRIVQESLNNVARHAGASQVAVAVKHRGARVELSVADNGRGLPELSEHASERSGVGLLGMTERVAMLDGEFRIRRTVPQGTTVEVALPLA